MKNTRTLLIGLLLGGGFGVSSGNLIIKKMEVTDPWLVIESGLIAGAIIGLLIASLAVFIESKRPKRKATKNDKKYRLTY